MCKPFVDLKRLKSSITTLDDSGSLLTELIPVLVLFSVLKLLSFSLIILLSENNTVEFEIPSDILKLFSFIFDTESLVFESVLRFRHLQCIDSHSQHISLRMKYLFSMYTEKCSRVESYFM